MKKNFKSTKENNGNKPTLTNHKIKLLRTALDKMNFLQPFDVNSLSLIENLYNELTALKKKISHLNSNNQQLKNQIEENQMLIAALQTKTEKILKENQELHTEVNSLLNKISAIENETAKRINDDNISSMTFLINQLKKKNEDLRQENYRIKEKQFAKMTNLFEKGLNCPSIQIQEFSFNDYDNDNQSETPNKRRPKKPTEDMSDFSNKIEMVSPQINFELSEELDLPIQNRNDFSGFSNNDIKDFLNKSMKVANQTLKIKNLNFIEEMNKAQSKIFSLERELNKYKEQNEILNQQISKFLSVNVIYNDLMVSMDSSANMNNNLVSLEKKQNIIIDYLKNELKTTREKNDAYIKYLLEKQKENFKDDDNSQMSYRNLLTENKELKQKESAHQNEIFKLNSIINVVKNENSILVETLKKIQEKKTDIKISKTNNFGYSRVIKKEEKIDYQKMIDEMEIENQKKENEKNELLLKITDLEIEIKNLNEDIKLKNYNISELQDTCNSINQSIFMKQSEDSELFNKYNTLVDENNELQKHLQNFETERINKDKTINTLTIQLQIKAGEIEKLKDENAILQHEVDFFKLCKDST